MCGIAGFVSRREPEAELAGLHRALRQLHHRGPDDSGWLTFPDVPDGGPAVGLGNRRLSIIDLSVAGHQPMTTADGRYSITYNGEIYNYREIRSQLEAAGHRLQSRSDTEVLLHAYAAWGADVLGRLEGMFAFAILDRVGRRLVLARDAFGIKPLFYAAQPDRFVFGSEIAAVLAFGGVGRRVAPAGLYEYLVNGDTGSGAGTLLQDVRQVTPATLVTIGLDRPDAVATEQFWSASSVRPRSWSFADATEQLRTLLIDTVRVHLQSDVPVGFAVSGGTDSSSVLLAARAALGPSSRLRTFGFVTEDAAINEEPYQEQAAAACAAERSAITLDAGTVTSDFDAVVDLQGEPFASPTVCAQYRVFARARDAGVKVILGGQGSDELFAGYQRYASRRVASLLRGGRWVAAARFARASGPRWGVAPWSLLRGGLSQSLPAPVARAARRVVGRAAGRDWVNERWFAGALAPTAAWRPRGRAMVLELVKHEIQHVHLQDLLRYEDRNAMALSMENRVPFVTTRLAEFVLSLPEEFLVSARGVHKAVLREAMRGMVPASILDRTDKIGFAVPFSRWLIEAQPWVREKLALAAHCPALDLSALQRHWWIVQLRGDAGSALLLWRCFALLTWAERSGVEWA